MEGLPTITLFTQRNVALLATPTGPRGGTRVTTNYTQWGNLANSPAGNGEGRR
jgi:hypothetical protein